MRSSLIIAGLLLFLCSPGTNAALAACTATVTSVNFGPLDPSLPPPSTVSGTCSVSIACAPRVSVTLNSVTSSNAGNMVGQVTQLIPYMFNPGIAVPATNPDVRKNPPWVINCSATVSNYQQAWSDNSITPTQYLDTVVYSFTAGGTPFSATVQVPATVLGQCKATAGTLTQTVSFGPIVVDAATGDQIQNLAPASMLCTNGLPYTISYTGANTLGSQKRMLYTDSGGANRYLNYAFSPTTAEGPGTGAGFAAAALPIGGTVAIPGIDLQNAFSDSSTAGAYYQDVINVNIGF